MDPWYKITEARKMVQEGRPQTAAIESALCEATTLDRVHAAILLQAGGQAAALGAMLEAETQRSPDFLRLATPFRRFIRRRAKRNGCWTRCFLQLGADALSAGWTRDTPGRDIYPMPIETTASRFGGGSDE
jgi:hypothetical protein